MKDLLKYPLNIQLFADDVNEETGADENNQGEDEQEEKTFTQAEVDALISKEKARAKKAALNERKNNKSSTNADENEETPKEENPYLAKYTQSEIKLAMVKQGIDAKRVDRAVRLLDGDSILVDGEIDAEALDTAIADLLKEWPELAPSKSDEETKAGIRKIGSDSNKAGKGKEDDLIAQAFGNKK